MTSKSSFGNIGGYTIQKILGEGTMGAVYEAKDVQGKKIAIKIITESYSEEKVYVQRFIREVKIAMKLQHNNIVRTFDFGIDFEKDILFAVMEYIPSITIKDLLKEKSLLSAKEALLVVAQVTMGLQYAHQLHIIHRDIKPANILVSAQGVVKIVDFGLAKEMGGESLTETGTTLGSPLYISPEQAQGSKKLDIRSDVYSLGTVFFEMLTGCSPFNSKTLAQMLIAHITKPFPPLRAYLPDCSLELQLLLDQMTKKKQDQRLYPLEILELLKKFPPNI